MRKECFNKRCDVFGVTPYNCGYADTCDDFIPLDEKADAIPRKVYSPVRWFKHPEIEHYAFEDTTEPIPSIQYIVFGTKNFGRKTIVSGTGLLVDGWIEVDAPFTPND